MSRPGGRWCIPPVTSGRPAGRWREAHDDHRGGGRAVGATRLERGCRPLEWRRQRSGIHRRGHGRAVPHTDGLRRAGRGWDERANDAGVGGPRPCAHRHLVRGRAQLRRPRIRRRRCRSRYFRSATPRFGPSVRSACVARRQRVPTPLSHLHRDERPILWVHGWERSTADCQRTCEVRMRSSAELCRSPVTYPFGRGRRPPPRRRYPTRRRGRRRCKRLCRSSCSQPDRPRSIWAGCRDR